MSLCARTLSVVLIASWYKFHEGFVFTFKLTFAKNIYQYLSCIVVYGIPKPSCARKKSGGQRPYLRSKHTELIVLILNITPYLVHLSFTGAVPREDFYLNSAQVYGVDISYIKTCPHHLKPHKPMRA